MKFFFVSIIKSKRVINNDILISIVWTNIFEDRTSSSKMTTLILNLSILNEEMNGYLKSIDIYIYKTRREEKNVWERRKNRIDCQSWQVFVRARKESNNAMKILFSHLSLSTSSVKIFFMNVYIKKSICDDWWHPDNDTSVCACVYIRMFNEHE